MHLLILSRENPFPANNGVKMRNSAIIRALFADGHQLTILYFTNPSERMDEDSRTQLSDFCQDIKPISHLLKSMSSGRNYRMRILQLFSRLPWGVITARSGEMKRQIALLVAQNKIDAIICEESDLLINLPTSLPVPLVVDFHNVDHLIFDRYAKFEVNPAKRVYALLESRKLQNWERSACQLATLAFVCSHHDKSVLEKMCPNLPFYIVPNTVDIEDYKLEGEHDELEILYQGGMDWYPNRDAVSYFVSEIMPILEDYVPDTRFVIAGRDPSLRFRERFLQFPRISFTGTVKDMRAQIARAAVCIVPLRIGSGTRLKILEAAAMGKAIVSTKIGAEGLDFLDAEEILIADEPRQFAHYIARLLQDAFLRRRLGKAARQRVEHQYSLLALRAAVHHAMGALEKNSRSRISDTSISYTSAVGEQN